MILYGRFSSRRPNAPKHVCTWLIDKRVMCIEDYPLFEFDEIEWHMTRV